MKNSSLFLLLLLSISCSNKADKLAPDNQLSILAYGKLHSPEWVAMNNIISEFSRENSGVAVDANFYGDTAYHEYLAETISASQLPDVVYLWPSRLSAPLFQSGSAVDLRSYISMDRYNPQFVTAVSPYSGVEPGIYCLPLSMGISSIFYVNTKILRTLDLEIPRTLDELIGMLPDLRFVYDRTIAMGNKSLWVMNSTFFGIVIARLTGNPYWLIEAVNGKNLFTSEEFIAALEFVSSLYKQSIIPADSRLLSYDEALEDFLSDETPFMIDGHWRIDAMDLDSDFLNNLELYPFPDFGVESMHASVSGGRAPGYGITTAATRTTNLTTYAAGFVEFTLSDASIPLWINNTSFLPPIKNIDKFTENEPLLQIKKRIFQRMGPIVEIPDQVLPEGINTVLNQGLSDLAFGTISPKSLGQKLEAAR